MEPGIRHVSGTLLRTKISPTSKKSWQKGAVTCNVPLASKGKESKIPQASAIFPNEPHFYQLTVRRSSLHLYVISSNTIHTSAGNFREHSYVATKQRVKMPRNCQRLDETTISLVTLVLAACDRDVCDVHLQLKNISEELST